MLKLPYGKIYRFRCWNVADLTGHAGTNSTVHGTVTTHDTQTDQQVDQGNMVFTADGDLYYDIPAEVATLDRYAKIVAQLTTADLSKIIDTEVYRVQFTDMTSA